MKKEFIYVDSYVGETFNPAEDEPEEYNEKEDMNVPVAFWYDKKEAEKECKNSSYHTYQYSKEDCNGDPIYNYLSKTLIE